MLITRLAREDIATVKTGAKAGAPNLTNKGIQQTLENFFKKVSMEDTSNVDVISAFIENTSELGQLLRKEILAGYKKFSIDPNPQEIEERLTEGARTYLENMTSSADEG